MFGLFYGSTLSIIFSLNFIHVFSTTEPSSQSSPSASSTSSRSKRDSTPSGKGGRSQQQPHRSGSRHHVVVDQHALHRKTIGHVHHHHPILGGGGAGYVGVVNGPRSLALLAASGEYQTSTPRSLGIVRPAGGLATVVVEVAGPEHDKLESQLAAISRMKR